MLPRNASSIVHIFLSSLGYQVIQSVTNISNGLRVLQPPEILVILAYRHTAVHPSQPTDADIIRRVLSSFKLKADRGLAAFVFSTTTMA